MLRRVLLVVALGFAPIALAKTRPWKPHPIKVIPGVPLKAEDIKPYVPPKLPPEPELEPSDAATVEVTAEESIVSIRPWPSPMVGNAVKGARLPVRGMVTGRARGCASRVWYALQPFGYLCGRDARPTDKPPSTEDVLQVPTGERLPFHYVMVVVKEGVKVPLWASFQDAKDGAEPERELEKGDTVAVLRGQKWGGESYWLSVDGKALPQKGTMQMGGGSAWQGLALDERSPLPFGWITPAQANAYLELPDQGKRAAATAQLPRRARVAIVEEQQQGRKRWLKVKVIAPPPERPENAILVAPTSRRRTSSPAPSAAPADAATPSSAEPASAEPPPELWVSADVVNEVRRLERPSTVPAEISRWIDIDLGEQVLVTYEGDRPTFATLISSGRAIATPMGTYPVWAKVSAITMKNQPYEDKGYYVNKVPWSTFFQWHNAIHGAYWHDRFGVTKSHGCVNVAPLDARRIFEWVSPPLPPGWTGLRPLELLDSPMVVVRNSRMKKQFRQDRPIGPPDRELESQRLEEAEQRRSDEAAPPDPATSIPGLVPASAGPAAPAAPAAAPVAPAVPAASATP